ncbi:Protein bric-a-brac 2 like protein [Argiope bruennichi]|uniref:Protein bric-a-brac 2 like protein n=1 Tax=Argiope bruennichi TaxID=94029 RepID=A0A8T0FQP4_ARGBR|nr:Protein bric-a-brac 2 like protein [Argiope bruennichi]
MAQQYRLKWSNHMSNVVDMVKELFSTETLVDVTLACDGMSIKAHKVILSACSPFFQTLLSENPCKHPIIIIPHMKYSELKPLVEFMYEGEVSVTRDQLATLTKHAQQLRIKGLAEISFGKTFINESPGAADLAFNPPGEVSSSNEYPGDNVPEQCLSSFNYNDNSKEEKAKAQSSDIEELTNNILINANNHYEASQSNDSFQNSVLPESADIDHFQIEPSKSLEQITMPNHFSDVANDLTTLQSQEKNPESNIDCFSDASQMSMPFETIDSSDQPETLEDIKSELIESDPSISPIPGPSHDIEDPMMMDQSSISSHADLYEESNASFAPIDYQPQGNTSVIRTICFSKTVPDNEEAKNGGVPITRKKWKYRCYRCNLLVASRGHLDIHMRTHTGERPFSCHICGKTAVRQHDLQLHMRTHSGIKPYVCPICGMKFNNSSNYRRHYKRRHPTAERIVQLFKVHVSRSDLILEWLIIRDLNN